MKPTWRRRRPISQIQLIAAYQLGSGWSPSWLSTAQAETGREVLGRGSGEL